MSSVFAEDYQQARALFCEAAERAVKSTHRAGWQNRMLVKLLSSR